MPQIIIYPQSDARRIVLDSVQDILQRQVLSPFQLSDRMLKYRLKFERDSKLNSFHPYDYFSDENELLLILIRRYNQWLKIELDQIEQKTNDSGDRLLAYIKIHQNWLNKDKICLGLVFLNNFMSFESEIQQELEEYNFINQSWLFNVLGYYLHFDINSDIPLLFFSHLHGLINFYSFFRKQELFEKGINCLINILKSGYNMQEIR